LEGKSSFPIFGDDPLNTHQEKAFSVSPVVENGPNTIAPKIIKDEIDQLSTSFADMAKKNHQQFVALQSLDSTRRELIANVSHDLLTPLASMQGYIETLIIKDSDLSPDTKKQYLETAYKHSQRLNSLIAQLFELARLDSGSVKVSFENFSLTELIHNSV